MADARCLVGRAAIVFEPALGTVCSIVRFSGLGLRLSDDRKSSQEEDSLEEAEWASREGVPLVKGVPNGRAFVALLGVASIVLKGGL
jgi:hypothetical protein